MTGIRSEISASQEPLRSPPPPLASLFLSMSATSGHWLIRVGLSAISVIIYLKTKYRYSIYGTEIANDSQEATTMNLLIALFKILVWAARSVALILVVLVLSALLMFSHKQ
jgi:hypothetical protein